jgi:hypothetical protein
MVGNVGGLNLLINGVPISPVAAYGTATPYLTVAPATAAAVSVASNTTASVFNLANIPLLAGKTYTFIAYGSGNAAFCGIVDCAPLDFFNAEVRFGQFTAASTTVVPFFNSLKVTTFPSPIANGVITDYTSQLPAPGSLAFADSLSLIPLASASTTFNAGNSFSAYLIGDPANTARPLSVLVLQDGVCTA